MSYFAVAEPESIAEGDYDRLAFYDASNDSIQAAAYPYNPAFLAPIVTPGPMIGSRITQRRICARAMGSRLSAATGTLITRSATTGARRSTKRRGFFSARLAITFGTTITGWDSWLITSTGSALLRGRAGVVDQEARRAGR